RASRVANPYPSARRPAITPGRAWASSMEPSVGWEPTCMSTICPGLAVSSTRAVTEATLRPPLVPCQPSVSTVHRTGTYPRSLRTAMVRASRSPYGKRNQGRGSVPKSRRSARSVARTSSWTWPADRDVKWGWVVEWLPTRWPASTIDRVAAGNDSMNVPVRKKVPGTPSARSVARIDATASAFAPASKVSATTFRSVGMTSRSRPARCGGTAGAGGGPGGRRDGTGGEGSPVGGGATGGELGGPGVTGWDVAGGVGSARGGPSPRQAGTATSRSATRGASAAAPVRRFMAGSFVPSSLRWRPVRRQGRPARRAGTSGLREQQRRHREVDEQGEKVLDDRGERAGAERRVAAEAVQQPRQPERDHRGDAAGGRDRQRHRGRDRGVAPDQGDDRQCHRREQHPQQQAGQGLPAGDPADADAHRQPADGQDLGLRADRVGQVDDP